MSSLEHRAQWHSETLIKTPYLTGLQNVKTYSNNYSIRSDLILKQRLSNWCLFAGHVQNNL